jgi:hypothetical protein
LVTFYSLINGHHGTSIDRKISKAILPGPHLQQEDPRSRSNTSRENSRPSTQIKVSNWQRHRSDRQDVRDTRQKLCSKFSIWVNVYPSANTYHGSSWQDERN